MAATLGIVDIGSHSVLLLAARGDRDDPLVILEDYRITALGESMGDTGLIQKSALQRTEEAIALHLETCRAHGVDDVRLVATSALREASNRREISEKIASRFGKPVRVLTEAEEAALTRRGALSGLGVSRDAIVADVGGRSTEITWPGYAHSIALGCQRETDRFFGSDPPPADTLDILENSVSGRLNDLPRPPDQTELVCSGGTATTLAAIELALPTFDSRRVHGYVLDSAHLGELARRLTRTPEAQRRSIPGLEPGRSRVIPAGAMIVVVLLRWARCGQLLVSARGLTWGAWLEAEASVRS